MTDPTYFTVVGDWRAIIADSTDSGADPDIAPVTAQVTFTPMINTGDVILATQASPRPTGFVPTPITGYIDTDGRLKMRTTAWGDYDYTPVRLLADTPLLALSSPLIYKVSFANVTVANAASTITSFFIEAPSSDVVVDLIEVGRVPGQNAVGITKLAPGSVALVNDTTIQFSFGDIPIPDPISLEGLRGATGATGATGAAATIAVGSVTTGAVGSTATVSNSGTSGAAVLQFSIPRGDTGPIGATGARGATGERGEQGIQGIQGVQGQAGVSLDINGTLANYAAITAISSPAAGDAYVNAADGKLYFYDGTSWPADGAGVPFVGPIGPQGIPGPVGDAATIAIGTVTSGSSPSVTNVGSSGAAVLDFVLVPGATGRGDTGSVGPTGATGAAATISVGTVTTGNPGSSVSVVNSGTSSAAVFDITIPRGDTGSVDNISWDTLSGKPTYIGAGSTQAAARAAIGAGTSDLVIGTTAGTAKAGNYQPAAADISDSTSVGRDVLKAASQADARTAIGAGTSSLELGTTSSTAKAGNYTPSSSEITTALGYTPENPANKNQNGGYAGLSSSGLVDPSVLPSYVDDVLEYANLAAFPGTGVSGKIYIAADTGRSYRWSGSLYAEIIASPGTTDAVTEGSTNLYFTNARADGRITAAVGSTVQGYSSTLTTWAGKTAPAGTVVGTTDTQTLSGKTISGSDNTLSNIGVSSLSATGTASSSTFLRGDGTWQTVTSGMSRNVSTITTNTTLGSTSNTDYVTFISGITSSDTSVLAMLNFDGTNNSTTMTDSSSAASNWTASGNAKLSTSTKKYGTAALYCDGSSNTGIKAASTIALSSDFTVEFWVNWASITNDTVIFDTRSSTYTNNPCLVLDTSSSRLVWYVANSAAISGSNLVTTNTWYHLAVSRLGSSTKMFINGTQEGSTFSDSTSFSATLPCLGARYTLTTNQNAYFDDLRICNTAKYTSNFTAPTQALSASTLVSAVPTLPTAVSNTNLYALRNISGASITVGTTSSQTINGGSLTMANGDVARLISDGSNWYTI